MRASQWLRREHAAYVDILLLALDAWLSQNIQKRLETSLRGQTRGSVCVGSDLSDRNMMKLEIGFTQKTAAVVTVSLYRYLGITLHSTSVDYTLCGNGFYSYRILNRTCRSAALPYPEHGCRRMLAPMRSPCILMIHIF